MNKIILIGRLTKDPDTRSTSTGKKVANFSLAINEGKDSAGKELVQFFNCVAWEKLAENIEKFTKKGDKISVVGKLENKTYTKQDGTKNYSTEILVKEIEFLGNSIKSEPQETIPSEIDLDDVDFGGIEMPFN